MSGAGGSSDESAELARLFSKLNSAMSHTDDSAESYRAWRLAIREVERGAGKLGEECGDRDLSGVYSPWAFMSDEERNAAWGEYQAVALRSSFPEELPPPLDEGDEEEDEDEVDEEEGEADSRWEETMELEPLRVERACQWCGRDQMPDVPRLLACSGCKTTFYCSAQHQKNHWKGDHKAICRRHDVAKTYTPGTQVCPVAFAAWMRARLRRECRGAS